MGEYSLATCQPSIGGLGLPLSTYPTTWISIHSQGAIYLPWPTLELIVWLITHITRDASWASTQHMPNVHTTLIDSKDVKFRPSRNSTKFDVVARFRETISTVKSVSSSKIYKNLGFLTEITDLPFVRKSWIF